MELASLTAVQASVQMMVLSCYLLESTLKSKGIYLHKKDLQAVAVLRQHVLIHLCQELPSPGDTELSAAHQENSFPVTLHKLGTCKNQKFAIIFEKVVLSLAFLSEV